MTLVLLSALNRSENHGDIEVGRQDFDRALLDQGWADPTGAVKILNRAYLSGDPDAMQAVLAMLKSLVATRDFENPLRTLPMDAYVRTVLLGVLAQAVGTFAAGVAVGTVGLKAIEWCTEKRDSDAPVQGRNRDSLALLLRLHIDLQADQSRSVSSASARSPGATPPRLAMPASH